MTYHAAAQVVAHADADVGRALHLISLTRGQLEALETAIAGQDARGRLRALTRIFDLFDELQKVAMPKGPL